MKRGREDGAPSLGGGKRAPGAKMLGGPQAKLTTTDALSYLREVKNRFATNMSVYDAFLEIMKDFKAQAIDTHGVIKRVKRLFFGHRALVLGFNTFLPKGYEIELARVSDDEDDEVVERQPVEFDQAINYVNKIKRRFATDDRVYKAFLEILNLYRTSAKTIGNVYKEVAVLFQEHQDLLDEFVYFLPDSSQPAPPPKGRGASQHRPGLPGNRGPVAARGGYATSVPEGSRSVHKRKAAKRAEEGFKAGYGSDSYDKEAAQPALAKEMHLFERIKQRLRNKDAFMDLLKCLNLYGQEIVARQELMLLVGDILGKYPDLVSDFQDFLGKVEVMELEPPAKGNAQLNTQRELIRKKQLQKDKYLTKPLSEIVANETERVTPSYALIPVGFPKLVCSGRTQLGINVLNDAFAGVISGSEDYSFKLMRKNQYEEALFRCEDDRYEFDMCIETNAAALKLLRPVVEIASKLSAEERGAYQLAADHPLHGPVPCNAVERLYAESGALMVEHLRKSPALIAPIVVPRLEQKDAEWRKIRTEMTEIWKKIFEMNYHKSLDHRSFYFKQAEKKTLNPKLMVSEIREAHEARVAQSPQDQASVESRFQAMLCESRRHNPATTSTPDLEFHYSDRLVFGDCWTVLRTAILESTVPGTNGPRGQLVDLYLETLEPIFGLDVRKEDQIKLKAELKERRKGESVDGLTDNSDLDERTAKESTPEAGEERDEDSKKRSKSKGSKTDGGDSSASEGCNAKQEAHFAGVQPLAPLFLQQPAVDPDAKSAVRLLLGNEMVFIFFRLHRHLYDRLSTARQCAAEKDDSTKIHAAFMDMTMRLFTGGLEAAVYEDQVRALLGTHSYQLFTIDKLVHKLLAHMRMVVYDDQTAKLLELHKYEQQRSSCGASSATTYHVNANAIIDDDVCYRIECREEGALLSISLLTEHGGKSEAIPGPAALPMEGHITETVESYLDCSPSAPPNSAGPVYLPRNLSPKERTPSDELIMGVLQSIAVYNGLECRVGCTSSKVSYVGDTEDVMCHHERVHKRGSESVRQDRCERFKGWLDSAMGMAKAAEAAEMAVAEQVDTEMVETEPAAAAVAP